MSVLTFAVYKAMSFNPSSNSSSQEESFNQKENSCPICHFISDQYQETGKCLCGYNLKFDKVLNTRNSPNLFTRETPDQDIYDMMYNILNKSNIRRNRTQIQLMVAIYEFFKQNPDYDYPISEIMVALGYKTSGTANTRYAVELALFRLQKCEFIQYCRNIGRKATWQLKGWKTKT